MRLLRLASLCVLAACTAEAPAPKVEPAQAESAVAQSTAANSSAPELAAPEADAWTCPPCGMNMPKDTEVHDVAGRRWVFCNDRCRALVTASPEQFVEHALPSERPAESAPE